VRGPSSTCLQAGAFVPLFGNRRLAGSIPVAARKGRAVPDPSGGELRDGRCGPRDRPAPSAPVVRWTGVSHPDRCRVLARFLAERDEAAFEWLVWRHGPALLGLCRRLPTDGEKARFAKLQRERPDARQESFEQLIGALTSSPECQAHLETLQKHTGRGPKP
jgi:hypothetical protein